MRNWAWPQPCRKRELNTTPVVAVGHGRGAGGRRWGMAAVPVGGGGAWPGFEATRRATSATRRHWCGGHRRDPWAWLRGPWAVAGPGRASRRRAERSSQRGRLAGGPPPTGTHSGRTRRRPEHQRGNKQHEAARPHRGPGGSRIGPLGGSQRLFQRICVPAEPRRWQASTTRAAMPASADLPHVRGSYCFLMPTSPSILRTPS